MDYSALPDRLAKGVQVFVDDPNLNAGVQAMRERWMDLPHRDEDERRLAAELIGLAIVPEARANLEALMDLQWQADRAKNMGMGRQPKREVIIGSGYHAAVYCAIRARLGFPPPFVIEANELPGGNAFAMSRKPSFYANSRNRAGAANSPGEREGLNVIPGAIVQPSMLSGDEYQTNADLAFVIRLTLAMHAKVACGKRVIGVFPGRGGSTYNSKTRRYDPRPARLAINIESASDDESGRWTISAERVIDARGLGAEVAITTGARGVMTFSEFMRTMDEPFPLRGIRRVAVIGGGDSGKCAVEALFGMSPAKHWSTPELDQVERCDWYCELPNNCEDFRVSQRARYKGISALLPRQQGSYASPLRIRGQAQAIEPRWGGSPTVNQRRYDLVITCQGYLGVQALSGQQLASYAVGETIVATKTTNRYGTAEMYVVGPAAGIPFSGAEVNQPWAILPENLTAMWRLGPRTATLAAYLK